MALRPPGWAPRAALRHWRRGQQEARQPRGRGTGGGKVITCAPLRARPGAAIPRPDETRRRAPSAAALSNRLAARPHPAGLHKALRQLIAGRPGHWRRAARGGAGRRRLQNTDPCARCSGAGRGGARGWRRAARA